MRISPIACSCMLIACGNGASQPASSASNDAGADVLDAATDDIETIDAATDAAPTDADPDADDVESGLDADALVTSRGWLAVIGGGSEGDIGDDAAWSADVYGWIVDKSNHGRVAILAADPQTDFLSSYFTWLGASEAVDVTVGTTAEAADPQRIATLASADAIFIKGGDQARYLSAWNGSDVLTVLADAYANGKVVAGTSAGAHVLGGVIYDAQNGSVRLNEAVRDPWDAHVTFSTGFLSALPDVVLDTHFTERGRLARLAPMLARLVVDDAPSTRLAIGLDDRTGLLVDPQGTAEVRGEGSVTVLRPSQQTAISASPGAPASVARLAMDVLGDGYRFALDSGEILAHPAGASPIVTTVPPNPPSNITLDGGDAATALKGSVTVSGASPYALVDGELSVETAEGAVPGFVIVSRCYMDAEMSTIENRIGGVQWALGSVGATVPMAMILDEGAVVEVKADSAIEAKTSSDPSSILLLDGRSLTEVSTSPYAPRQSVSLVGAELYLLRPGDAWQPQ